jgi:predicted MFS family arabinose efflux permease
MNRQRLAITTIFFANGALVASWASRIPAIADHVGASVGQLGLVLLCPALGAVVTMPFVGRRLAHGSSRFWTAVSMLGLTGVVLLPAIAPSLLTLGLALVLLGVTNGALDIAMNAQGVTIERRLGRPILSSLHAAFSFGGFAGAGLGAAAAALHVSPLPHLAFAALLFGGAGLLSLRSLLPTDEDPDATTEHLPWRKLPTRLLLMGVACFFCFLGEGASLDWSAKLVDDALAGSAALGAIAYAVFSAGMGCGRLVADRLWARWGAVGLLRRSGALAAVGFAIGLGIGTPASAIAGFLALGLGLSGVAPTLFRSAADEPGVPTGPALAATSSLGYLGFLAGPPIIGGLAATTSLYTAAFALAVAAALVFALAGTAAPPRARTATHAPDPRPSP